MEYKDYYKTLGVARDVSADELKKAYRKLARKFHPDVSKETQAEERFKEVQEAYEVLKDPEKRQAYNELGNNWRAGQDFRPPPGWNREFHFHTGGRGGSHFSDFFEQLFGSHGFDFGGTSGGRAGRRRATRGQDREHRIEISLEEAFRGGMRQLQLRVPSHDGAGRIVEHTRTLNVRIPSGVRDGQSIRLGGQGDAGTGGASAGDLFLKVSIRPHPLYRVNGSDIELELPVTPWEAALGARVEVPTLAGRVAVNVPAGSQSGKRLRLRGKGLPAKDPGDFYVVLNITNPPMDDAAVRELFGQMAEKIRFDPRAKLGT